MVTTIGTRIYSCILSYNTGFFSKPELGLSQIHLRRKLELDRYWRGRFNGRDESESSLVVRKKNKIGKKPPLKIK